MNLLLNNMKCVNFPYKNEHLKVRSAQIKNEIQKILGKEYDIYVKYLKLQKKIMISI